MEHRCQIVLPFSRTRSSLPLMVELVRSTALTARFKRFQSMFLNEYLPLCSGAQYSRLVIRGYACSKSASGIGSTVWNIVVSRSMDLVCSRVRDIRHHV